jgi:hypothetical protein
MVMIPAKLGTKNDCAGEDQQQFATETVISSSYNLLLFFFLQSFTMTPNSFKKQTNQNSQPILSEIPSLK